MPKKIQMPKNVLVAAAVATAVLLAAGCGGSSDSSSSDTSPTATWADGLCSALNTWKSSLTETVNTVKDGSLSKDSLTTAVDDAKSATETLTSDLEGLGKPDTEAGQQAKDSIDQLSTDLKADMTKIEDAVNGASGASGILSAVSVVTSTLVAMGTQVTSTITDIQGLDAKGELKSAFDQSASCQELQGSLQGS